MKKTLIFLLLSFLLICCGKPEYKLEEGIYFSIDKEGNIDEEGKNFQIIGKKMNYSYHIAMSSIRDYTYERKHNKIILTNDNNEGYDIEVVGENKFKVLDARGNIDKEIIGLEFIIDENYR